MYGLYFLGKRYCMLSREKSSNMDFQKIRRRLKITFLGNQRLKIFAIMFSWFSVVGRPKNGLRQFAFLCGLVTSFEGSNECNSGREPQFFVCPCKFQDCTYCKCATYKMPTNTRTMCKLKSVFTTFRSTLMFRMLHNAQVPWAGMPFHLKVSSAYQCKLKLGCITSFDHFTNICCSE